MSKIKNMDLTQGPIIKSLIIYAIPLMLTHILQTFFHAADIAVVGIFVSDDAVAAVGANTSLTSLVRNLFIGFSVGSSVVLSKYVGAKNVEKSQKTVGTAIAIAIISGIILLAIGVTMARTFLIWMDCDAKILDWATTYLRIIFLGAPISMLYNFSASILRAAGDTKRPLIFLAIGGTTNVLLNVFMVAVCDMNVAGVAIATIVSNAISATLCLITLFKSQGYTALSFKSIKINKEQLLEIIKIGIPTGLQSASFGIANVLIQSTVNSFGSVGMSANTAASQFDSIIYMVGNSVAVSVMTFVGQNVGAKNLDRVKKSILCGMLVAVVFSLSVGGTFVLLAPQLCGIIVSGEQVIQMATVRLTILGTTYFMASIMETLANAVRAMGRPVVSLVVSVICAVVLRITLLKVLFALVPEFWIIYITWPLSWVLAIIIYSFMTPKVFKQLKQKLNMQAESQKA